MRRTVKICFVLNASFLYDVYMIMQKVRLIIFQTSTLSCKFFYLINLRFSLKHVMISIRYPRDN